MPLKNRYPILKILVIQGLYILGFLLWVIAAACIYGYGREVVLSFGSNDKSLVYWYLPILFIGIGAFWSGAFCGLAAFRMSRKLKASQNR